MFQPRHHSWGHVVSTRVEPTVGEHVVMRTVDSTVLDDERYTVPAAPPATPGTTGMAWLRANVPRFCDGADHRRRRLLLEAELHRLRPDPRPGEHPTDALLRACGLEPAWRSLVDQIARAYQPHAEPADGGVAADRAVEVLAAAIGGASELAAARICLLVQCHAGTTAALAADVGEPPIATTRRLDPTGEEVAVDLHDAHFGRGRHACPGADLARELLEAARR